MGLIAATITRQAMIAYKHDLEYKIMVITQARIGLDNSVKDLMNAGSDLDPENPIMQNLEDRKKRLNDLEKKLDMEIAEYQTKLKMAEANLEMAKSMEEKAISNMKG